MSALSRKPLDVRWAITGLPRDLVADTDREAMS